MATYSTDAAIEPRALTALFKDREDADAAYEWLLKNGYNSSDIHIHLHPSLRLWMEYSFADLDKLEQKIREGSILISVRSHSVEDAELIESAWRERGGEMVQY